MGPLDIINEALKGDIIRRRMAPCTPLIITRNPCRKFWDSSERMYIGHSVWPLTASRLWFPGPNFPKTTNVF